MKKTKFYRALLGDPILRKKAKAVSKTYLQSKDFDVLSKELSKQINNLELIGMAANQIRVGLAVAVIDIRKTKFRKTQEPLSRVLVNPKIIVYGSKTKIGWEGCGSIPDYFGKVRRSVKVVVSYMDTLGDTKKEEFSGLAAVVVQHEIDHLNGIMFTDRMSDLKSLIYVSEYMKMIKARK